LEIEDAGRDFSCGGLLGSNDPSPAADVVNSPDQQELSFGSHRCLVDDSAAERLIATPIREREPHPRSMARLASSSDATSAPPTAAQVRPVA
jgi:hypothetical protein